MKDEEINKIFKRTLQLFTEYPFLRCGQSFFVALNEFYPEIADEIIATENDSFYNDENVKNCINYLLNLKIK